MTKTKINSLQHSELGKHSSYKSEYDASLLFPLARKNKREEINITGDSPFTGSDILNAYELSWLNPKGKPQVAIGEFIIPCESPQFIESKSLKLYLNSLNDTKFTSKNTVREQIATDLSTVCQANVDVTLSSVNDQPITQPNSSWQCLDALDISVDNYEIQPTILQTQGTPQTQKLYSHLLKSNCLVTGQPDWGSLFIEYHGAMIEPTALLQYIISFRHHNEFHEQCVERIFMDIKQQCQPEWLTVFARYTRRGGIDINPYRTNHQAAATNQRLARQ